MLRLNKYNQKLQQFYSMKSKLQTTIGELYKLKNQMRVQLNQIRPKQLPNYSQKKQRPAKRLFTIKFNESTNIANPSVQKSKSPTQSSKRMFDRQNIVFTQSSRMIQKKHYQRHYADNVHLENNLRPTTCSYFNVKPSKQINSDSHHNTSLTGIGLHEKSKNSENKSRKRIFQEKLAFKPNFF